MKIQDVARLAGVSVTTVSRVINGESVREAYRQRVSKVIHRYNYSPNTFARGLGRSKKKRKVMANNNHPPIREKRLEIILKKDCVELCKVEILRSDNKKEARITRGRTVLKLPSRKPSLKPLSFKLI